jgi:hypothetical protein
VDRLTQERRRRESGAVFGRRLNGAKKVAMAVSCNLPALCSPCRNSGCQASLEPLRTGGPHRRHPHIFCPICALHRLVRCSSIALCACFVFLLPTQPGARPARPLARLQVSCPEAWGVHELTPRGLKSLCSKHARTHARTQCTLTANLTCKEGTNTPPTASAKCLLRPRMDSAARQPGSHSAPAC